MCKIVFPKSDNGNDTIHTSQDRTNTGKSITYNGSGKTDVELVYRRFEMSG